MIFDQDHYTQRQEWLNRINNHMGKKIDEWLFGCIYRVFLINIDNEKIIQQFQNMKMCSEI